MFRAIYAVLASGLLLAACGSSKTDRALSGGGIGALGGAAGSLILGASPMGGLAGGLLGGAAGAAFGALTNPDENDPSARGRSAPTASPQEPQLAWTKEVNAPLAAPHPALDPVAPAPQEIPVLATERRIALVIGNGAYRTASLRNPRNDAHDMAVALRELGFEVIEKLDVGQNEMLHAVIEFGLALQDGGVGLFYYAGHGLQLDGKNYLIPTDAVIERGEYVPVETLDLDQVLARMDAAHNRLNIVILDACRDNPFARGFRSVPRGLAQSLAPAGTFLAYATAPGDVAADGGGANSPYAEAILAALKTPGLALEEVFKRVGMQVRDRTGGQQTPWTSSSVVGDFYFRPPVEAPVSAQGYGGHDVIVWNSIKDNIEPHDLETFLQVYPNSPLAPFAQRQLEALGDR